MKSQIFSNEKVGARSKMRDDIDRGIVLDLIDSLLKPPNNANTEYVNMLLRVVNWIGTVAYDANEFISKTGATPTIPNDAFRESSTIDMGAYTGRVLSSSEFDTNEKIRNLTNQLRAEILGFANSVGSFVIRARNDGFGVESDPFILAAKFNIGRTGFSDISISADEVTAIHKGVTDLVSLVQAEKAGIVDIDRNIINSALMSSMTYSLDGLGGSGNVLSDLAKILPDSDKIRAQKASEALSILDFPKRKPKIMFTCLYSPDNVPKGIIVCWKRMHDASGYLIKRRNIFTGKEILYSVNNQQITEMSKLLEEYVGKRVLSLYDNVPVRSVFSFIDNSAVPNAYYYYSVSAYLTNKQLLGSIFSVETSPVFISESQKILIRNAMEELDPASGPDTISPYPVLSHFLLGNSKFDWIIAAVNTRASISRGDSRQTTRKYSYISALLDFIFELSANGKFVMPKGNDMTYIMTLISKSLMTYGISQVVKDVVQETGVMYYFDGKDSGTGDIFRDSMQADLNNSGIVGAVLASVDPESATLDIKSLSANMPKLMSGEFVSLNDSLKKKKSGKSNSKLANSSEVDMTVGDTKDDEIQNLRKIDETGMPVDLTTAEGLGTMMRAIRIFSDIGPGKGLPLTTLLSMFTLDPVMPPPPVVTTTSAAEPTLPPEKDKNILIKKMIGGSASKKVKE